MLGAALRYLDLKNLRGREKADGKSIVIARSFADFVIGLARYLRINVKGISPVKNLSKI